MVERTRTIGNELLCGPFVSVDEAVLSAKTDPECFQNGCFAVIRTKSDSEQAEFFYATVPMEAEIKKRIALMPAFPVHQEWKRELPSGIQAINERLAVYGLAKTGWLPLAVNPNS